MVRWHPGSESLSWTSLEYAAENQIRIASSQIHQAPKAVWSKETTRRKNNTSEEINKWYYRWFHLQWSLFMEWRCKSQWETALTFDLREEERRGDVERKKDIIWRRNLGCCSHSRSRCYSDVWLLTEFEFCLLCSSLPWVMTTVNKPPIISFVNLLWFVGLSSCCFVSSYCFGFCVYLWYCDCNLIFRCIFQRGSWWWFWSSMPSDLIFFDVNWFFDGVRVRPAHGCSYLGPDSVCMCVFRQLPPQYSLSKLRSD